LFKNYLYVSACFLSSSDDISCKIESSLDF